MSILGITFATHTDAYLRVFRGARSRAAAAVSASRLFRSSHVQAARAWYFAKVRGEIPHGEREPETPEEVYRQLREARRARAD